MKVLDLFSGIGGFSLGLERAGMTTVAFCEIDPFCRRVLRKHWPGVPIFEDVRTLRGDDVGPVDLICGGYPCQPFSSAGQRRGEEDDRHLWPEFNRLVAELRPTWVCGENVAGHISMGLDDVLSDLEGQGYACRAFVIPAVAVDAPHRRDRVWIIGHADRGRQPDGAVNDEASGLQALGNANGKPNETERRQRSDPAGESSGGRDARGRSVGDAERQVAFRCSRKDTGALANTCSAGLPGAAQTRQRGSGGAEGALARGAADGGVAATWREWPAEPGVGRVAHGVPDRVDRLRALGNAVVPRIPEVIGRAILDAQ